MVRRNIFSRAASIGCQMRSGGEMRENLFIDNRGAGFVTRVYGNPSALVGIWGNGLTEQSHGIALGFEMIRTDNGEFVDNVATAKKSGAGGSPVLNINPMTTASFIAGDPPVAAATNAVMKISGNVFYKNQQINAYFGSANKLTFTNNTIVPKDGGQIIAVVNNTLPGTRTFSGNAYGTNGALKPFSLSGSLSLAEWKAKTGDAATAANLPDPNRDVTTYMKSRGEVASVDAFMINAAKMKRGVDTSSYSAVAVINYLRAGFGKAMINAPAPAPVPVPTPIPVPLPPTTAPAPTPAPNIATLSGFCFNDDDGDGRYDSGEVKTAGKTVYLDANGNDSLDAGEKSTVTDAAGNYSFKVAAGTYKVRRVFPPGYKYSNAPINVAVAAGESHSNLAIGSTVIKTAAPVPAPAPAPKKKRNR
jgi:hypothetical protein